MNHTCKPLGKLFVLFVVLFVLLNTGFVSALSITNEFHNKQTITAGSTGSFLVVVDDIVQIEYTYPAAQVTYKAYSVLEGSAKLSQKEDGKLTFSSTGPAQIRIDFTAPKNSFGSSAPPKVETTAVAKSNGTTLGSSKATLYVVNAYSGFGTGEYLAKNPQRVSLSAYGTYFFKIVSSKQTQVLSVLEISDDFAVLLVQPKLVTVTLKDGESQFIDADANGEYDTTLKLMSHSKSQISFTIGTFTGSNNKVPPKVVEVVEEPVASEPEVIEEEVQEEVVQPEPEVIQEPVVKEPTPPPKEVPESQTKSMVVVWIILFAAIAVCGLIAYGLFMFLGAPDEHVGEHKKKKEKKNTLLTSLKKLRLRQSKEK